MSKSDRQSEVSFPMGRIVMTANAVRTLPLSDVATGLLRHARGDWGDVGEAGRRENESALSQGSSLHSAYHNRRGVAFWVMTEATRSLTTVLLPDDY